LADGRSTVGGAPGYDHACDEWRRSTGPPKEPGARTAHNCFERALGNHSSLRLWNGRAGWIRSETVYLNKAGRGGKGNSDTPPPPREINYRLSHSPYGPSHTYTRV